MDRQPVVCFHTLGDTNLKRAEDASVFVPPWLVGVLDGAKAPFGDNTWPGPQSPTQRLVSVAVAACHLAGPGTDLPSLAREINRRIRETLGVGGAEDPAAFPSATFALGRVTDSGGLEILQGADSLIAIEFSDGSHWATPNTVFRHTSEFLEAMKGIEPKSERWHEVRAEVLPAIQGRINKPGGWPMLNGDDAVEQYWLHRAFEPGKVGRVLFFTDGLISLSHSKAMEDASVVRELFRTYDDRGFEGIYESTRQEAMRSSDGRKPYVGEATAVALNMNT